MYLRLIMKYAVALTLYNPSIENLNNLRKYVKNFDKVFIYDNSSDNKAYKKMIPEDKNIYYFFNGNNDGLPRAFNKIIYNENIKDCDYICTMDQDSIFESKEIEKLKKFIESNDNDEIAIFSPFIIYNDRIRIPQEKILFKEWVICSGSFIKLDVIKKNKLYYDENYFIDRFEVDLCKQLRLLGFKIIMYTNSTMNQELGTNSGYRHSNHSPFRHYYIFRNRLYFNKKYYNTIKALGIGFIQSIKHIILILLFEEEKIKKFIECINGLYDYSKNKFGIKGGDIY